MKLNNIRNIGICAHIDAGKTTLTERILFYTGKKHKIGEVHNGEAEMDWMDQEQERGITINSASTSVYWKGTKNDKEKHKINIIDTPGHVDFTAEVERSMRILDGACIVICAVSGIQAQTETVWEQMNRYKIPRISFINKMDRKGSNYKKIKKNIKKKFKIETILINYPIVEKGKINGFIDLIEQKEYIYRGDLGETVDVRKIRNEFKKISKIKKEKIIEKLSNVDEVFLEKYIEKKITKKYIKKTIKKLTKKIKIIPIFLGSAFKNIGVQNLLDGIIDYLPKPKINKKTNEFSSLVFKTTSEIIGKLIFIKIYSGKIEIGDYIINQRNRLKNKIKRIIQINANKKEEKKKAKKGDIVALIGIKDTFTGDTLSNEKINIKYEKIRFPKPVISISIKPKKKNEHDKLIKYIKEKSKEDPTIIIKNESKETILVSGMGELHLDVFIEKIRRETGINITISKPKVNYKETINKESKNVEGKYIRQSGGRGQYGHVVINIYPIKTGKGYIFKNMIKGGVIPKEYIKTIKKSIKESIKKGPILGYEVIDVKIELVFGSFHEIDSNENAFKIASCIAVKNALKISNPTLLEPIMIVKINTPCKYIGNIMGDLSSRRGEIIYSKNNKKSSLIKAKVPLSELFNYSTILRSKTKGKAYYEMKFKKYKKVSNQVLNKIIYDNKN